MGPKITQSQSTELSADILAWRTDGIDDDEIKRKANERVATYSTSNGGEDDEPEIEGPVKGNQYASKQQPVSFSSDNDFLTQTLEETAELDEEDLGIAYQNTYEKKKERFETAATFSPGLAKSYLGNDYKRFIDWQQTGLFSIDDKDQKYERDSRVGNKIKEFVGTLDEDERIAYVPVIKKRKADVKAARESVEADVELSARAFESESERVVGLAREHSKRKKAGEFVLPEEVDALQNEITNLNIVKGSHIDNLNLHKTFSNDEEQSRVFYDEIKRTHSWTKRLFSEEGVFDQTGDALSLVLTELMTTLPDALEPDWVKSWNKEAYRDFGAGQKWRDEYVKRSLTGDDVHDFEDGFEFLMDGVIDNAPMLATFGSGLVLSALPGGAVASAAYFRVALPLLMGAWSAGNKLGEYSYKDEEATKRLKTIDAEILKAVGPNKAQLVQQKGNFLKDVNRPAADRYATAILHGVAETVFERLIGGGAIGLRYTKGVAAGLIKTNSKRWATKYSTKILKSNPELLEKVYLRSSQLGRVGIDISSESLSEALTQIAQNYADITVGGEDKNVLEGVRDAAIHGGFLGGILGATNSGFQAYLMRPLTNRREQNFIKSQVAKIEAVRTLKSKAEQAGDWKTYDKYAEREFDLMEETSKIVDVISDRAGGLSGEELKTLFTIQSKIDSNRGEYFDLKKQVESKGKDSSTDAAFELIDAEFDSLLSQREDLTDRNLRNEDFDILDNPNSASLKQVNGLKDRLNAAITQTTNEKAHYDSIVKKSGNPDAQQNVNILAERLAELNKYKSKAEKISNDKLETETKELAQIDSDIQDYKDEIGQITKMLEEGGHSFTTDELQQKKQALRDNISALQARKKEIKESIQGESEKAPKEPSKDSKDKKKTKSKEEPSKKKTSKKRAKTSSGKSEEEKESTKVGRKEFAKNLSQDIAKDSETIVSNRTRTGNILRGYKITNSNGVTLNFKSGTPSKAIFNRFLKAEGAAEQIRKSIEARVNKSQSELYSYSDPVIRSLMNAISTEGNIKIVPVSLPFGVDGRYLYASDGSLAEIQINSEYVTGKILWHEAGHGWVSLAERQRPALFARALEELRKEENSEWYNQEYTNIKSNPDYSDIHGNLEAIDREILVRAVEDGPTTSKWRAILDSFLEMIGGLFGIKGKISANATLADIAKLAQIEIATGESQFTDIVDGFERSYDPSVEERTQADISTAEINRATRALSSNFSLKDSEIESKRKRAKEAVSNEEFGKGNNPKNWDTLPGMEEKIIRQSKIYALESKSKVVLKESNDTVSKFNIAKAIKFTPKESKEQLDVYRNAFKSLTAFQPFAKDSGGISKGHITVLLKKIPHQIQALEYLSERVETSSMKDGDAKVLAESRNYTYETAAQVEIGKITYLFNQHGSEFIEIAKIDSIRQLKTMLNLVIEKRDDGLEAASDSLTTVLSRGGKVIMPKSEFSAEYRQQVEGYKNSEGTWIKGTAEIKVDGEIEKIENFTFDEREEFITGIEEYNDALKAKKEIRTILVDRIDDKYKEGNLTRMAYDLVTFGEKSNPKEIEKLTQIIIDRTYSKAQRKAAFHVFSVLDPLKKLRIHRANQDKDAPYVFKVGSKENRGNLERMLIGLNSLRTKNDDSMPLSTPAKTVDHAEIGKLQQQLKDANKNKETILAAEIEEKLSESTSMYRNFSEEAMTQPKEVVDQRNKAKDTPHNVNSNVYDALNYLKTTKNNHYTSKDKRFEDEYGETDPSIYAVNERLFDRALVTGKTLLDSGNKSFYHDYFFDSRGRFYPSTVVFNHQGSEWAKAMQMFDVEKNNELAKTDKRFKTITRIGKDGLDSMYAQAAETWGKGSAPDGTRAKNMSFAQKVSFAKQNMAEWMEWAASPQKFTPNASDEYNGWTKAKEFALFFATINEIHQANEFGSVEGQSRTDFVSGLPYYRDATNSGVQILSWVTLDEKSGKHVNVVPNNVREDLYVSGGNAVINSIPDIAKGPRAKKLLKEWLKEYGRLNDNKFAIRRKMNRIITEFKGKSLALTKLKEQYKVAKEEFSDFTKGSSEKHYEERIEMFEKHIGRQDKRLPFVKALVAEGKSQTEIDNALREEIKEFEKGKQKAIDRLLIYQAYFAQDKVAENIRSFSKSSIMTMVYNAGQDVRSKDVLNKLKPEAEFNDLNFLLSSWFVQNLDNQLKTIIEGPINMMETLGTFAAENVSALPRSKGMINGFLFINESRKSYSEQVSFYRNREYVPGYESNKNRFGLVTSLGSLGLDASKIKIAMVPNWVHFLDAQLVSAMYLNTNIPLITIHDSFATTFDNAGGFRDMIDDQVEKAFDFVGESKKVEQEDGTLDYPMAVKRRSAFYNLLKETAGVEYADNQIKDFKFGDLQVPGFRQNEFGFSSDSYLPDLEIEGVEVSKVRKAQKTKADELGVEIGDDIAENRAKITEAIVNAPTLVEQIETAKKLFHEGIDYTSKGASKGIKTKATATLVGSGSREKFWTQASSDIYGLIDGIISSDTGYQRGNEIVKAVQDALITNTWDEAHKAYLIRYSETQAGIAELKKEQKMGFTKLTRTSTDVTVGKSDVKYDAGTAVQAYLFNLNRQENEDISEEDFNALVDYVEENDSIREYALGLNKIIPGWVPIQKEWSNKDIKFTIESYLNKEFKQQMLVDFGWVKARDAIFTEQTYNKIIATYSNGNEIVESLKSVLSGMWTGSTFNRESESSKSLVKFMSGFTALALGGNLDVGIKQMTSFINFAEADLSKPNNLGAFTSQMANPEVFRIFKEIWKSEYGQNRLGSKAFDVDFGLLFENNKIDAKGISKTLTDLKRRANDLLFAPISFGDMFAISYGGAIYIYNYQNHFQTQTNPDTGENYTAEEAYDKAFDAMVKNAEETQQSKKATRVSSEQRTVKGKLTTPFTSFQHQALRKSKATYKDIKRKGDKATPAEKRTALATMVFYQGISPLIFSLISQGVLALLLGDDDTDRKKDVPLKTLESLVQFSIAGLGIQGAIANMAYKLFKEIGSQMYKDDYDTWKIVKQALTIVPGAGIAAGRFESGVNKATYENKWKALPYAVEFVTRIPLTNAVNHIINLKYLAERDVAIINKAHIALGFSPYSVGVK